MIVNVAVVDAHVPLPLVGFRVIEHVPLFTVNAYVAVALLYVDVAALVTVMFAEPAFTGVIVTVPLLIVAVATPVALLATLNVPLLVFVLTVNVLVDG